MKINVLLIAPSVKNKGGISSVISGYLNCNQNGISYKFIPSHREGAALVKIVYFATCYVRCVLAFMFKKIDVVHMHVSERASITRAIILYKLCRFWRKPVILHHHGAEFMGYFDSCSEMRKKKIETLLSGANKNVVLSNRVKNLYEKKFSLKNVEYVYNGVEVTNENLYMGSKKDIVLFLGRIGQRKGTFDLLEAINLLKVDKEVDFYFCGDGELEKLENEVSSTKKSNIKILKWISGNQKEEILSRTIVNVLPSYHEGLPMTILETMARGIPNISTNVDSIPEAINYENGILIAPGDVVALKEAIEKMISDDEFRMRCSVNAYETVLEEFSIQKTLKKLKDVYEEVAYGKD